MRLLLFNAKRLGGALMAGLLIGVPGVLIVGKEDPARLKLLIGPMLMTGVGFVILCEFGRRLWGLIQARRACGFDFETGTYSGSYYRNGPQAGSRRSPPDTVMVVRKLSDVERAALNEPNQSPP